MLLVTSVEEGGPAEIGGVQTGDLILALNGDSVKDVRDLQRKVAEMGLEERVIVTVLRESSEMDLEVVIGRMSQDSPFLRQGSQRPQKEEILGMSISSLTEELRRRYNIGDQVEGVVVVEVARNSSASRKGIRPGDVIVRVGNRQVRGVEDVRMEIEAVRGQERPILFTIVREGLVLFLALPLRNRVDELFLCVSLEIEERGEVCVSEAHVGVGFEGCFGVKAYREPCCLEHRDVVSPIPDREGVLEVYLLSLGFLA